MRTGTVRDRATHLISCCSVAFKSRDASWALDNEEAILLCNQEIDDISFQDISLREMRTKSLLLN